MLNYAGLIPARALEGISLKYINSVFSWKSNPFIKDVALSNWQAMCTHCLDYD